MGYMSDTLERPNTHCPSLGFQDPVQIRRAFWDSSHTNTEGLALLSAHTPHSERTGGAIRVPCVCVWFSVCPLPSLPTPLPVSLYPD